MTTFTTIISSTIDAIPMMRPAVSFRKSAASLAPTIARFSYTFLEMSLPDSYLSSRVYKHNMERKPHYTHDLWGNPPPLRRHGSDGRGFPRPDPTMLRERLQQRGIPSLSTTELLSLVLTTEQARETIVPRVSALLAHYPLHQLLNADFGQVAEEYGLGEAKAAQLQATLEIARRLLLPSAEEKYTIRSVADAAAYVRPEMEHLAHEEVRVLLLDTRNQVVSSLPMYQGTVNSSVLRASEIFRPAVTRNCPGIILCHNHPSGDPTPSAEDIEITRQLVEAGKVLEVELIDHIVIGKNSRFVSLKERLLW